MNETLHLLYRDPWLVAIDKPPGLLVHRSELARHETEFAVQRLRDQLGQVVHPVHRLDRGTSGVLLFALESGALQTTSAAFEGGLVHKRYLAVVRGHPPETGEIDHPLAAPTQHRTPGVPLGAARDCARAALTRYRRLASTELPVAIDRYPSSRYALLELEPITGRSHQLRRHLKHIAHPIIGDATYGKGRHNRYFRDVLDCDRLLLACTHLRLTHPVAGTPLHLHAPLSGSFLRLLQRLGWEAIYAQAAAN